MDATHFRQRAARAREMAQSGEDIRLSRMLLEVAHDLDAEAAAIEAEITADCRGHIRPRRIADAALQAAGVDNDRMQNPVMKRPFQDARTDRSSVELNQPGTEAACPLPAP